MKKLLKGLNEDGSASCCVLSRKQNYCLRWNLSILHFATSVLLPSISEGKMCCSTNYLPKVYYFACNSNIGMFKDS